jgi:cupin 2 domain-containing protein
MPYPGDGTMRQNLFASLPLLDTGEVFEDLFECRNVRIERISSSPHPDPVLYDQVQDEWVCLLRGEAELWIDGETVRLEAGDFRAIPAGVPHRVLWTSDDPRALWLAVHILPNTGEPTG